MTPEFIQSVPIFATNVLWMTEKPVK